MHWLNISIALIAGFAIVDLLTHPQSKIYKKIPYIKLRWIQISPCIKIHARQKTIHCHHWITLSIILVISIFVDHGILSSSLTKGFLAGGILQDFTFPDWKKIIDKSEKTSSH